MEHQLMIRLNLNYVQLNTKECELKLTEIIYSVEFNIGQIITNEAAGFICDVCRKHQFDINDKIKQKDEFFY